MNFKKAFTLIELLVVISVIGLLLAIMLPALKKVSSKAKSLVCLTNEKQLAVAIQSYVTDNNDEFFPYYGSTSPSSRNLWMAGIAPYIGNTDQVRICPQAPIIASKKIPTGQLTAMSAADLGVAAKSGLTFTGNARQYAWNWVGDQEISGGYCINGYLYTTKGLSGSSMSFLIMVSEGEKNLYGKITNIPTRAAVPMLADGIWPDFWPIPGESPIASTTWSKGGYVSMTVGGYMSRILFNRHDYRLAVCFLDGHADTIDILKLEPWDLSWRPHWRRPTETEANQILTTLQGMPD